LFAFSFKGGSKADRAAFVDGLQHFGIGFSWGGYESLALPVDPERIRTARRWEGEGPLVRLHIGLEDVDDLIEDLAQGLARYGAAA
jgi:cystathionine beta-lyase